MADLHVTKDRIDIIDNYTGENKSIMLNKDAKEVIVSFGADETPVEIASNASVQPLVEQVVTEQLPALLEGALADYAKKSEIPNVGEGVVSIYQGASLAGSFNVNQADNSSISLAAGGGSDKLYHINARLNVVSSNWQTNSSTTSTYGYYNDCVVTVTKLPVFETASTLVELFIHMMYDDIPYGYEKGISDGLCPYGNIVNVVNNDDNTQLTIRVYAKTSGWGANALTTRISFFIK